MACQESVVNELAFALWALPDVTKYALNAEETCGNELAVMLEVVVTTHTLAWCQAPSPEKQNKTSRASELSASFRIDHGIIGASVTGDLE